MDRGLSWNDRKLKLSYAGPVYSKYRPVVVFRKFQTQMECLPLYTHNGRGIEHKSDGERKEWISVVDGPETDSPCKDTDQQPLAVLLRDAEKVRENTFIHVTESMTVTCAEYVKRMGMMEESSFKRLHRLRVKLNKAAQQKALEEDRQRRGR